MNALAEGSGGESSRRAQRSQSRHPDKAWAMVFPDVHHGTNIGRGSAIQVEIPFRSYCRYPPYPNIRLSGLCSLLYPVEFRFVNTDLEGASVGWDVPTLVDEDYRKQVPKSGFLCRSDNSPNAVPPVVEFEGSALAGLQIVHKPPPASVRK